MSPAGVIDADYRGNVGVLLFNFGNDDFTGKVRHLHECAIYAKYKAEMTKKLVYL